MQGSYRVVSTSFGCLALIAGPRGLRRLLLPAASTDQLLAAVEQQGAGLREDQHLLPELCTQLHAYFDGEPVSFTVPLDLAGHTAFEADVWQACRAIPYGQTCSYGQLAERVLRPGGARAVGHAMSRNPVPLVVPCHRVLRGDGTLGGYSGPGGVGFKRRLLELETAGVAGVAVR